LTTKISLSYGQRRLWTLDKIEQNGATYNMPLAVRLHGPINIDALASALTYIIERHESLRTLITESEDGHPVGILTEAPSQQEPLIITDLSALQHTRGEGKAQSSCLWSAKNYRCCSDLYHLWHARSTQGTGSGTETLR